MARFYMLTGKVSFSGLLKKLLAHEDGSQVLMALNMDGTTLLGVLKKLLLSKREVLQIGVAQILNLLLQKQAGNQYGAAILESDLAGRLLFKMPYCRKRS